MIPFKGIISTALGFYGLSQLNSSYFGMYQSLLDSAIIFYVILETTQVCHISFISSRFLKERIDFNQGLVQVPTIVILIITALAGIITVYYSMILPVSAESISLWIASVLLFAYTLLAEKSDAIIMNGALMALYLTVLTSQDMNYLQFKE